jgi:hypothetical protein
MPTLFQILKDKIAGKPQKKQPEGPQIYNPINAKVGCAVTIDDLDYRGNNFFVKEIHELDVAMGGKSFKTADYVLQANPLQGDAINVRLRVCPAETGTIPFRALVLSLYDELEFNEGLHNVVKDDSKKFVVDDEKTGAHEEYWRVNDVGISYPTAITTLPVILTGSNKIEYWDYSRMTKIDGVEIEQFLFVEMNTDSGYFQIWRGSEINPEQVMVL